MAKAKIDPLTLNVNTFQADPLLRDISSSMPRAAQAQFSLLGQFAGSHEADELARLANHIKPQLRTSDAFGEGLNLVEYHPAWHALQRKAVGYGLHASVWDDMQRKTAGFGHQMRTMSLYLSSGLDAGHLTPSTSTHASLALILANPALNRDWSQKLLSRMYDSTDTAPSKKTGLLIGLAMSERKSGGSIDQIDTTATRVSEGLYRLDGEKWHVSAPMSDAFIVLAQTNDNGNPVVSCFLVPRLLQDSSQNQIEILRLREQIGYRSNPQAEMKLNGSFGFLLGHEGEGMRTILDAITLIRHDIGVISAGLMRSSLAKAVHFWRHNTHVQGDTLKPRVLADMALDVAGATALMMRVARSYDKASASPIDAAYARLMTPVAKYWVCKTSPNLISETMESVGSAAFAESSSLGRNHRDAVTNLIYETGSDLMTKDVLRVLTHGRELFNAVVTDVTSDLGAAGVRTKQVLEACMSVCETDAGMSRLLTEQLALAGAASELKRAGAGQIAEAFMETRLGGAWRSSYGMLDARFDATRIVDLLYPPSQ
jgi:putative acyl-CoA dehydrogenase